jgi:NhaP-type Na+/H+ or K+/H+ antiporter
MLNDHTASKGALMITSCLDRNGGCRSCLQIKTNSVLTNWLHENSAALLVLFWGGLRGALALALALGLPSEIRIREQIISVTFAVVAFSIFVQGLTMTPLLRQLRELPPEA